MLYPSLQSFTTFYKRWKDWFAPLINVLLLLLLLFTIYDQVFAVISLSKKQIIPKDFQSKINIKPAPIRNEISISTWHLFGVPETLAEDTQTPWILRGIIVDRKGDNVAIIASSDTNENTYHAGEKLADGTTILKILSDHILIVRSKTIQSLYIPWNENTSNLNPPPTDGVD